MMLSFFKALTIFSISPRRDNLKKFILYESTNQNTLGKSPLNAPVIEIFDSDHVQVSSLLKILCTISDSFWSSPEEKLWLLNRLCYFDFCPQFFSIKFFTIPLNVLKELYRKDNFSTTTNFSHLINANFIIPNKRHGANSGIWKREGT